MQLDPDFVDAPPRPAPSTGAGSEPGPEPETFPSETAEQRLATAQRIRGVDTGQFGPVPAPGVERRELQVPTRAGVVRARLYRPTRGAEGPGWAVWIHGGGFVLGDLDTAEHTAAELCRTARVPVVSLEYRRAPEHPFPDAIEDCQDAVYWLAGPQGAAWGLGAGPFAVAGDSAGASLALALCQLAVTGDVPQPAFALLAYPDVDHADHRDREPTSPIGLLFERSYLPDDRHRANPFVSPVLASPRVLAGLPPTLLLVAELDPFRPAEERFADLAREAGAPLAVLTAGGMPHGFLDQTWRSPVARTVAVAAFAAVGEALRDGQPPA